MWLLLNVTESDHMGEGYRLINMERVEDIRPLQDGDGARLSFESGSWADVSEMFYEIKGMLGAGSAFDHELANRREDSGL